MSTPQLVALPTHTQVADHLERALALLRSRGWTQGISMDVGGRYCSEGAVYHGVNAHNEHRLALSAREALTRQITVRTHLTNYCLTTWNDKHDRTFKDVEGLFTDTIDFERKQAAEAGEL
jgi:hypothetical protein